MLFGLLVAGKVFHSVWDAHDVDSIGADSGCNSVVINYIKQSSNRNLVLTMITRKLVVHLSSYYIKLLIK